MGQGSVLSAFSIRSGPGNRDRYLVINADGSINVTTGGVPTALTPTPTVVSVSNASTALVAANASRRGALIQNFGATDLGIAFASPAVFAACSIRIKPGTALSLHQVFGVIKTGVWGIRSAAGPEDVGITDEV